MGVVCRHEYPLFFVNLFHGERYISLIIHMLLILIYIYIRNRIAYCMYILECLKSMYPNHEVQAMYDIACVLAKHLKVSKNLHM